MLFGRNKLILNETERTAMRTAGKFNAKLMDFLRPHVQPGVTTNQLDRLVETYTRDHGHLPACLGYLGYPKTICTSLNDVVCHGIPDDRPLREGDILNIDCTTIVHGWFGDSSETFFVGEVSPNARAVTQVALDCLYLGIQAIRPFGRVADIGEAIVKEARKHGYGVVLEYVGHGLGRKFHQPPSIPHAPTKESKRERIKPGMCFTVEPMINEGTAETAQDADGWTVRTADGKLSAQFEHTVLMTEQGPEILTMSKQGPRPGHKF